MRPIGNLPFGRGNREKYKAYERRYWRSMALDLVRSQMKQYGWYMRMQTESMVGLTITGKWKKQKEYRMT